MYLNHWTLPALDNNVFRLPIKLQKILKGIIILHLISGFFRGTNILSFALKVYSHNFWANSIILSFTTFISC